MPSVEFFIVILSANVLSVIGWQSIMLNVSIMPRVVLHSAIFAECPKQAFHA